MHSPTQTRRTRRIHQIVVALFGGPATLVDRPDDQTLSAPHVTRREHPRHARAVLPRLRLRVGPGVLLHPELIQELVLWAAEAHRQENQLGREDLLRAGDVAR